MNKAFIYIIIGAGLWGTIGWFVKHLYSYDFTPMEVVTLRVISAAIILILYLSFKAPKQLILKKWTDVGYFIGTGIFSITFFNYCMFMTIELSTIPVSTALLYTAPGFVIILSLLFFIESITKINLTTLLIT